MGAQKFSESTSQINGGENNKEKFKKKNSIVRKLELRYLETGMRALEKSKRMGKFMIRIYLKG